MAAELGAEGVRSDINVTPLIDVVLVLLIIFMVLAPTLEARFTLALPASSVPTEATPPPSSPPLRVHVNGDGSVQVNSLPVEFSELRNELKRELGQRTKRVAFFDAAASANYGRVVQIMDVCRAAGAKHIGIIEHDEIDAALPVAPAVDPP